MAYQEQLREAELELARREARLEESCIIYRQNMSTAIILLLIGGINTIYNVASQFLELPPLPANLHETLKITPYIFIPASLATVLISCNHFANKPFLRMDVEKSRVFLSSLRDEINAQETEPVYSSN